MKILKSIILVILSFLLLIMVPLSIFFHAMNETVLQPYSTNEYIAQLNFYQGLPERVEALFENRSQVLDESLEDMITEFNQSPEEVVKEMFIVAVSRAIDTIVTEEWLDARIDELQRNMWDYILKNTDTIEPIHIGSLKGALIEEFKIQLESVPIPEDQKKRLIEQLEVLPETLDVGTTISNPAIESQLKAAQTTYEQTKRGYSMLIWTTLFIFIIGVVISFYPGTIFRWSGYTSLLIGLFTLSSLIIVKLAISSGQFEVFVNESGEDHGFSNLLIYIFDQIFEMMYPLTLGVLILGILLALLSHMGFIKRLNGKNKGVHHEVN